MIGKHVKYVLALLPLIMLLVMPVDTMAGGNKRIMSINSAKVLAERSLLESVYGLKVRANESVEDMVAASFVGTAESKTQGQLKGVNYEEIVYDAAKDIAKVTATVSLPSITNINGETIDLKGKVFRRIAVATSTPSAAGPLRALRAAEIDAYKQLAKNIVGFTLESQSKVENYILTSDVVKTKVMASIFMAEVTEYGWHDNGDAYVKMILNLADFSSLVGQAVAGDATIIKVEGQGAQKDDFAEVKKSTKKEKQ